MGHDAWPSGLHWETHSTAKIPKQHIVVSEVTEGTSPNPETEGFCAQPINLWGCKEARVRGTKGMKRCGWKSNGSRVIPPVCTVSSELCGAGSRVKTRGTGLDRVLLCWDNVCGTTLKWGRKKLVISPAGHRHTPKLRMPQISEPLRQGTGHKPCITYPGSAHRTPWVLPLRRARQHSDGVRDSSENQGNSLHSPEQIWAPTSGPPQRPPTEPGAQPSPVRECNRLLGKVCRISGRVSSSPGKQLDTHGQEGQAGPLCCSARGTRWREAGPCSGRNALGETGTQ